MILRFPVRATGPARGLDAGTTSRRAQPFRIDPSRR
jgi:hypothetical protein